MNMKIIIIKLREAQVDFNLKLWYLHDIIHTLAAQQGVKVWGGNLQDKEENRNVYESFPSLIPFLFLWVSSLKESYFKTDSLGVEKAS